MYEWACSLENNSKFFILTFDVQSFVDINITDPTTDAY